VENSTQQAFLFFVEGSLAGLKIPIEKRSVVIGRGGASQPCDIVIPERQVSRQHSEIYLDQGRYFVRDLGSKNGTYVNGESLHGDVELHDEDEIQIALCERIRFIGTDATLPLGEIHSGRELRVDRQSRRVLVGSVEVEPPLSPAQYRLLELLSQQPGKVRSRDEIVSAVWEEADKEGVTEQAIDALVRRLRDRLAELEPCRQYVITVRGHGFRLAPTGEPV
jgi:pSer/pThr/pTyr-binding forkhead associated (FHA) protein